MRVIVDSANPYDKSVDALLVAFLKALGSSKALELMLLDRGNIENIDDMYSIDFPSYSPERFNAADSILVQKMCDHLNADLFLSLVTTPLRTPMVLLLSPLPFSLLETKRSKMEFELAAHYCEFAFVLGNQSNRSLPESLFFLERKIAVIPPEELLSQASRLRGKPSSFYDEWSRLRTLQAETDLVVWK